MKINKIYGIIIIYKNEKGKDNKWKVIHIIGVIIWCQLKNRIKLVLLFKIKIFFEFIDLYKEYLIKAVQNGKYNREFNSWIPMIYLPDKISVYDSETKTFEYISALDKENFEKITYSECECG